MAPVELPSGERAAVLAADAQQRIRGHAAVGLLLLLQTHTQRQQ